MINVVNCGGEERRADFDFLEGVFETGGVEEDVGGLHHVGGVDVVVIRILVVILSLQRC